MSRAVVAVCLFLGACTFTMSERLPSRPYRPEMLPRCSVTYWALAVDTAAALYGGYFLARDVMRLGDDGESADSLDSLQTIGFGSAVTVALVGSLVWGLRQQDRCERARHVHDRWLRARRP